MISGMVFDGDFNTGAYASWGPTVANRVPVHASGPYLHAAYYRATLAARSIRTGRSPARFGASACRKRPSCRRRSTTSLPQKLGIDRLAFRLRNALRDGQPTV
jgi:aldehyde oxidoreductase